VVLLANAVDRAITTVTAVDVSLIATALLAAVSTAAWPASSVVTVLVYAFPGVVGLVNPSMEIRIGVAAAIDAGVVTWKVTTPAPNVAVPMPTP
jgi:hypothetical protein